MATQKKVPVADVITGNTHESQTVLDGPDGPVVGGPVLPNLPLLKFCTRDLAEGCYKLTYKPNSIVIFSPSYLGTLRVENKPGGGKAISADLYKFNNILVNSGVLDPVLDVNDADTGSAIPIYARNKYYSYLRGTNYTRPSVVPSQSKCTITIEAEEFVYTPPPAGSFNGSFSNAPTRIVKIVLEPTADSNVFTGRLSVAGVDKGSIELKWVSKYFRRAAVEIDTLIGVVSPKPVNPGTPSEENFTTIFSTVGWRMTPIYNDVDIPVPAGITSTNCWSDADLHGLMLARRSPAANLDSEWRFHLLVVPGKMGCSRGKMYDQIGAHREAAVSYSNDGYPTSDSTNFGTAANQQQRNIPRAYIRSAAHELGHCCNMMHQELEGGSDNSIMTTTPSVANVLGSATTGAPGVFPTNINLGFNTHCRHHLIHFPDPVVRPGGMNWTAGHTALGGAFSPEADGDRLFVPVEAIALTIKTQSERVNLGEPLLMAWEVQNHTEEDFNLPSDIGLNIDYTQVSVTDSDGNTTDLPSVILECEHSSIKKLAPGKKIAASTHLFWSSNGFAFSKPGKHLIEMTIRWTYNGVPYGLYDSKEVWVDYPVTEKDNEVAALMTNNQVGMFVALGGNAYHLTEGAARIEKVMEIAPKSAVARTMSKFFSSAAKAAYVPIQ